MNAISEIEFNGKTIYRRGNMYYAQWIDARLDMNGYLYLHAAASARATLDYIDEQERLSQECSVQLWA